MCQWLRRHAKGDRGEDSSLSSESRHEVKLFSPDEEVTTQIPTQAQSLVAGSGESAVLVSEYKPSPDMDYLQVC